MEVRDAVEEARIVVGHLSPQNVAAVASVDHRGWRGLWSPINHFISHNSSKMRERTCKNGRESRTKKKKANVGRGALGEAEPESFARL